MVGRPAFPSCPFTCSQVKELPTLKDMDFLNKNQKVYIGEEEKKVFLEKLKRDVEVMIGVLWEMTLLLFCSPPPTQQLSIYNMRDLIPFPWGSLPVGGFGFP